MKPSEIARNLVLHDSVVRDIEHDAHQRTLRIDIELCNYMQPGFQSDDPEMVHGSILFSSVHDIHAEPELSQLRWSDQFDGQILRVEASQDPMLDPETLKIVIQTSDYRIHQEGMLVIRLSASECTWIPDEDRDRPA
ncbi:hypothetical protein [Sorangium sp. So ce233]|uniref:hypothetical protein n=1 Tax=Sorangium sp. So ce233 TaxID=3133290 RepID=UPI003F5DB406